jgi:cyclomaltodextrinase
MVDRMRRAHARLGVALGTGALLTLAACSMLAGYENLYYGLPSGDGGDLGDAGVVRGTGDAEAAAPLPAIALGGSAIYSVYISIFSPGGDFGGVSAQLDRIHALGFDVLSLMPVTPVGQPINGHPSFGSPYSVSDFYAVNPAYGTPTDLSTLIGAAHARGMYVILDEELNQTSWDNPLIEQHPEYYVHTDGNPSNPASIAQAFGYADVAQLDYATTQYGLQNYMTQMLVYWLRTYGVDGFRFTTVDMPPGDPVIPDSFWRDLRTSLVAVSPNVLLWADEEDPSLAGAPFALDYGWNLRGGEPGATGGAGLQQVTNGADAGELEQTWQTQKTGFANVLHTTLLQTWDFNVDLDVYGGVGGTMAAATFNFTIDGVPMLWNGEEVGATTGGADTHTPIDWSSPNASSFTAFYSSLVALRNGSSALQQGTLSWLANTAPGQVASYVRGASGEQYLVLINFSSSPATGTLASPPSGAWTDVSPSGSPGGKSHTAPPAPFSLAPYDFAVFQSK